MKDSKLLKVLEWTKTHAEIERQKALQDGCQNLASEAGMIRDFASELLYDLCLKYACKVCGNAPGASGILEHGRGCYTQTSDDCGESFC